MYVYVFSRHKAILDYLNAGGFSESFGALQKETQNEDFIPDPKTKYAGLLEKKWTSVIRLQKKVICQDILYHFRTTFFIYNLKRNTKTYINRSWI